MSRPLTIALVVASGALLAAVVAATLHTDALSAPALVEARVVGFGEDVVDRCPSCHLVEPGSELPTGHPQVPGYHPVERFGCSPCHGGEPRALDAEWAHGRGREPLLHLSADGRDARERLEAGCARCHALLVDGSLSYDEALLPHVAAGHGLFVEIGCWGCHPLADVAFGERGPDLSDVGRRLRGDEIHRAVEDPGASPSSTTMPRFRLAEEQLRDLTTFLLAQVDPERRAVVATTRLVEARRPGTRPLRGRVERGMAAGADVMRRLGCVGCHRLDFGDGQVGPDLRWEGDLRGPRFVEDMLRRPASVVAGSRMPPIDLTDAELEASSLYLGRLRGNPPPSADEAWEQVCARCHGLDGRGRTAVAPYLARRPRDLSDRAFFREAGHARFVSAMADGVPGTPMAPWGRAIPGLEGRRLVRFLSKRLHEGGLPLRRRLEVPPRPEKIPPVAAEGARFVFTRECSACHGPTGLGDGAEAAGWRRKPRDLTGTSFIAGLSDDRLYRSIAYGPPGGEAARRMPGHLEGYDSDTMWALVAKVRRLAAGQPAGDYEDDRWPWQPAPRAKTSPIRRRPRLKKGTAGPRRGGARSRGGKSPPPASPRSPPRPPPGDARQ